MPFNFAQGLPDLGRVLGVDPVTVSRRYARLSRRGEAWVSLSPGRRMLDRLCIAFVDVECAAGAASEVARALVRHRHMVTVERVADGHEILATVATQDLAALGHYTLDVLPALAGITAIDVRVVTHMFTEGGQWRIDALGSHQRAELTHRTAARIATTGASETTTLDRMLLARLVQDGRATYQALATDVDVSPATVKRRLDRLSREGVLRFRCDFARPLGGWPVAVTFRADVPPADLPEIGHALVCRRETRNCGAVSGPHNLILQASLHSVGDIPRLEAELASAHPSLNIVARTITLRDDKLLGRLLCPKGRSTEVVPPDVWADPAL